MWEKFVALMVQIGKRIADASALAEQDSLKGFIWPASVLVSDDTLDDQEKEQHHSYRASLIKHKTLEEIPQT